MEIARRQLGENTRAVHLPPPPETAQRPLGTPVYRTAAFAFSSAQEYAAVLGDQIPGYSYSRIDNPTVDAFARAIAAMEGANLPRWPAAQAFASGMAAISGVFWAFARAGAHVVASAALYGGTYSLLRNVLTRFGVETDFVDITDLDAVRAAVRPATRIIFAETIANPTTAVADLRQLGEIAHEAGALLVIDSTLAPPVICRAARARRGPGRALGDQVHRRPLRHHGRRRHRLARPDLADPRHPDRHRRVALARRRVPAPPRAGDAAGAGAAAVRDRLGVRGHRWPGTRPSPTSTTRGCPRIRDTSWPGGPSTPGRRASGSARSSPSPRTAAGRRVSPSRRSCGWPPRRPRSAGRTRSSRTSRPRPTASSTTAPSARRASTRARSASPSAWKTWKT